MISNDNIVAIPPGFTIKEQLINRNMNQKEFAIRMGMSQKHISRLINGEVQLTIDVALRLESVLGVDAKFWCNLESIYREKIARIEEEKNMIADLELIELFPYDYISEHNWVIETQNKVDRVNYLRKYFEVYQLSILKNNMLLNNRIHFNKYKEDKDMYELLTWIQKVKLEGRNLETKKINIKAMMKNLPHINRLFDLSIEDACKELQKEFINYGIAVVYMPRMDKILQPNISFYDGKKIVMGVVQNKDKVDFRYRFLKEIAYISLGCLDKDVISKEDEDRVEELIKNILESSVR